MQVLIGGIAEKSICIQPNLKIRQRSKLDSVRSVDNTEMSNAMVMVFPAPTPCLHS